MSVMNVTSFNKQGEKIKPKEVVLKNENVYKIIKKYIQTPVASSIEPKKELIKA